MKYFNKKLVILVFLALIMFSAAPKIALASVPTFEMNPILTGQQTIFQKITSVESITTALQSTLSALIEKAMNVQQLFEWAFQIATEALRRQLLNMIVDQIVNWIQGGGTPRFITDWPGFFRDAVDQAGGRFLQELGLGQLCSAFGFQLRFAFIPIPTFAERSSCTLSQVGVNIDNFLKDFKSGGWVAWDEMVLKPQNNIYGAYLMAWDEREVEKSAAQKAAEAEAQAGKGFLSVRRCIRSHIETIPIYPGGTTTKTVCDEYQIVTPGAVVGDLAAQALGSDIPYIISAKDFGAYVSAITNAILNRIFAEGVGLLHTAVSGGGGGGGGGISDAQTKCKPLLGTAAYGDCIAAVQSGIDIREFQKNNMIQIINIDLDSQNQLIGAKQATLTILNSSVGILQQLVDCASSTSTPLFLATLAATKSSLAAVQSDTKTITTQITQIQSDIIALQLKQNEIKAITDLSVVPSVYAQVVSTVSTSKTQSLVFSAQDETSLKQQQQSVYQQQLASCQQQLLKQQ